MEAFPGAATVTALFAGTGLSTDSGAFVASVGAALAAFGAFEAFAGAGSGKNRLTEDLKNRLTVNY